MLLQGWEIRINSKNLTDTKLGQLYTTYFEEIDGFDENRPHVLCNTCKFYLFKQSSGVIPLELLLLNAQLKSTDPSMSNKQIKGIRQLIRKVGIPSTSMGSLMPNVI